MSRQDRLFATIQELAEKRQHHRRVLVGFSGGKDSIATLSLAVKTFPEVIPFYREFVPGLRWHDEQLAVAKSHFGLNVLRVPCPAYLHSLKAGVFCDTTRARDVWKIPGNYAISLTLMEDLDCTLCLMGEKKVDSMARRRLLDKLDRPAYLQPLKEWEDFDVYAYLKANKIPYARSWKGHKSSGLDMRSESLLWFYDNQRDDYERIRKVFPYVEAVVARRKLQGIPAPLPVHQDDAGDDSPLAD